MEAWEFVFSAVQWQSYPFRARLDHYYDPVDLSDIVLPSGTAHNWKLNIILVTLNVIVNCSHY